MKRIISFKIKVMKWLGYVPVEHVLQWTEWVHARDGMFMTIKNHVVTEIEFFVKGTPKEEIARLNQAFARQKFSIYNLYYHPVQWSWRYIE